MHDSNYRGPYIPFSIVFTEVLIFHEVLSNLKIKQSGMASSYSWWLDIRNIQICMVCEIVNKAYGGEND